ncbi:hypothetical protein SS50377_28340 [Spironucleus salmonicida]|uniref:Uncharacterized protein n=1 Tax=Spironucleus salmonicida TaxID=348837 RepID=V6LLR4_9EUKA|nr:hypothetical protein SS50377_28340 [Spironucleus salmonicida]|eukprot:EST45552.1 Hypothetical protein SS50377_jh071 [Spironucleus salmonicida]
MQQITKTDQIQLSSQLSIQFESYTQKLQFIQLLLFAQNQYQITKSQKSIHCKDLVTSESLKLGFLFNILPFIQIKEELYFLNLASQIHIFINQDQQIVKFADNLSYGINIIKFETIELLLSVIQQITENMAKINIQVTVENFKLNHHIQNTNIFDCLIIKYLKKHPTDTYFNQFQFIGQKSQIKIQCTDNFLILFQLSQSIGLININNIIQVYYLQQTQFIIQLQQGQLIFLESTNVQTIIDYILFYKDSHHLNLIQFYSLQDKFNVNCKHLDVLNFQIYFKKYFEILIYFKANNIDFRLTKSLDKQFDITQDLTVSNQALSEYDYFLVDCISLLSANQTYFNNFIKHQDILIQYLLKFSCNNKFMSGFYLLRLLYHILYGRNCNQKSIANYTLLYVQNEQSQLLQFFDSIPSQIQKFYIQFIEQANFDNILIQSSLFIINSEYMVRYKHNQQLDEFLGTLFQIFKDKYVIQIENLNKLLIFQILSINYSQKHILSQHYRLYDISQFIKLITYYLDLDNNSAGFQIITLYLSTLMVHLVFIQDIINYIFPFQIAFNIQNFVQFQHDISYFPKFCKLYFENINHGCIFWNDKIRQKTKDYLLLIINNQTTRSKRLKTLVQMLKNNIIDNEFNIPFQDHNMQIGGMLLSSSMIDNQLIQQYVDHNLMQIDNSFLQQFNSYYLSVYQNNPLQEFVLDQLFVKYLNEPDIINRLSILFAFLIIQLQNQYKFSLFQSFTNTLISNCQQNLFNDVFMQLIILNCSKQLGQDQFFNNIIDSSLYDIIINYLLEFLLSNQQIINQNIPIIVTTRHLILIFSKILYYFSFYDIFLFDQTNKRIEMGYIICYLLIISQYDDSSELINIYVEIFHSFYKEDILQCPQLFIAILFLTNSNKSINLLKVMQSKVPQILSFLPKAIYNLYINLQTSTIQLILEQDYFISTFCAWSQFFKQQLKDQIDINIAEIKSQLELNSQYSVLSLQQLQQICYDISIQFQFPFENSCIYSYDQQIYFQQYNQNSDSSIYDQLYYFNFLSTEYDLIAIINNLAESQATYLSDIIILLNLLHSKLELYNEFIQSDILLISAICILKNIQLVQNTIDNYFDNQIPFIDGIFLQFISFLDSNIKIFNINTFKQQLKVDNNQQYISLKQHIQLVVQNLKFVFINLDISNTSTNDQFQLSTLIINELTNYEILRDEVQVDFLLNFYFKNYSKLAVEDHIQLQKYLTKIFNSQKLKNISPMILILLLIFYFDAQEIAMKFIKLIIGEFRIIEQITLQLSIFGQFLINQDISSLQRLQMVEIFTEKFTVTTDDKQQILKQLKDIRENTDLNSVKIGFVGCPYDVESYQVTNMINIVKTELQISKSFDGNYSKQLHGKSNLREITRSLIDYIIQTEFYSNDSSKISSCQKIVRSFILIYIHACIQDEVNTDIHTNIVFKNHILTLAQDFHIIQNVLEYQYNFIVYSFIVKFDWMSISKQDIFSRVVQNTVQIIYDDLYSTLQLQKILIQLICQNTAYDNVETGLIIVLFSLLQFDSKYEKSIIIIQNILIQRYNYSTYLQKIFPLPLFDLLKIQPTLLITTQINNSYIIWNNNCYQDYNQNICHYYFNGHQIGNFYDLTGIHLQLFQDKELINNIILQNYIQDSNSTSIQINDQKSFYKQFLSNFQFFLETQNIIQIFKYLEFLQISLTNITNISYLLIQDDFNFFIYSLLTDTFLIAIVINNDTYKDKFQDLLNAITYNISQYNHIINNDYGIMLLKQLLLFIYDPSLTMLSLIQCFYDIICNLVLFTSTLFKNYDVRLQITRFVVQDQVYGMDIFSFYICKIDGNQMLKQVCYYCIKLLCSQSKEVEEIVLQYCTNKQQLLEISTLPFIFQQVPISIEQSTTQFQNEFFIDIEKNSWQDIFNNIID